MADSAAPDCHYRPDLDVLAVRWPSHATNATTPADYEAVLHLPEVRCTHRWLFDVRRRPHTSAAAAQWVVHQWLPRAAALLPQPLRLAYLVAPNRVQELAADTPLGAVVQPATLPGHTYLLRIFTDEGEAVRWLLA